MYCIALITNESMQLKLFCYVSILRTSNKHSCLNTVDFGVCSVVRDFNAVFSMLNVTPVVMCQECRKASPTVFRATGIFQLAKYPTIMILKELKVLFFSSFGKQLYSKAINANTTFANVLWYSVIACFHNYYYCIQPWFCIGKYLISVLFLNLTNQSKFNKK